MSKIKNPLTVVASGAPDLMVRFYDYDGTLLSGAKVKSISALPTPPVHDGLTFLRWSKTLEAIQASENDAYVYGVYKPTDGKSRVRLSFTSSTLATTLWFSQTKSEGLEIDWGDGSATQRVSGEGTVSVLHTYAARGSYTITLTPDEDCEWSPGSGTTTANNSFVGNTARAAVTSVELGDNVTTFPQYCFYNFSGMTSVLMPYDLEQTSIGQYAFYGCSALQSITIPDSVTSIGENLFRGCSALQSITIPDSVTSIGSSAFYGCSALQSITIPDSVTSIGSSAFYGCSALQSITIPDSVTSIGSSAFYGCSGLTKIILPNTTNNFGGGHNSMFAGWGNLRSVTPIGGGGDVELMDRTSIGENLFRGCSALQSITIPDSVTSIGSSAFYGCSALQSITIPDSVTSIGENLFRGCSALQSITIPDSVTSIGSSAFYGCSGLTKIILPNTTNNFGGGHNSMFAGWGNLRSVTPIGGGGNVEIGNRTSIGENLFRGCSSLQSITIPDSVTSIGSYAFYGCSNYDTAFAAKAGTYSGNAFNSCSSVSDFTLGGINRPVTSITNTAFSGCTQSCDITIYTVPQYVTTLINNTRNGAINATIIIKAASDTVYEGVAYSAGETMVTSNPTV